jgi:protein involved in polysaccharide export with SLBB domain
MGMKFPRRTLWTGTWLAGMMLAAIMLAAPQAQAQNADPSQTQSAATADNGYRLGSGDELRVLVFGEDDLGGEFVIDGGGSVRLPLIGQVHAAGDTLPQFEAEVTAKLKDGYLNDPRINVEVINYRPFYIIGEVRSPGQYSFVNGMNILNAVALAGGYTTRADTRNVYLRRDGSGDEETVDGDQSTNIYPGDIIRVAERFF